MKIDMHTHSKPISACAHHEPELIPAMHKNAGNDGIVLTNHCYPHHFERLTHDLKEQAELYVETFRRCEKAGKEIGIRVYFGCEVKLITLEHKPEFLLYGITEELFLESFPLYSLNQKELFDFCNEHDIVMVQAHPFRKEQGYFPADINYMHGVEVYNPHPSFEARVDEALAFAGDKIKTAGSDFHISSQAGRAGMVFEREPKDQLDLRDMLKNREGKIFGI